MRSSLQRPRCARGITGRGFWNVLRPAILIAAIGGAWSSSPGAVAPLPFATNAAGPPGVAEADIRGLKALAEIPNHWLWLWWSLAALALAAALYWLWRIRRHPPAAPPAVPPVPPHVRARQSLLRALDLIHDPERFCVLVSGAIRCYLEDRFRMRAPERTTEEFLRELQHTPILNADQKQRLGEFLGSCDLVKFARHRPTETELKGIHDAALRLVEETEPVVPTAEEGAGAPAR